MQLRCVVFGLVLPVSLTAQIVRPDTTAVPADLVLGYMMQFGLYVQNQPATLPRFVVGRVPAREVAEVLPAGGIVLGGLAYGSDRYAGSTTVMLFSAADTTARAAAIAQLVKAGWRYPYAPSPMMKDGFQSTRVFATPLGAMCRDSASVSVTAVNRIGGGSLLSVVHRPASGLGDPCGPDPTRMSTSHSMGSAEIPVPELIPPPDAIGGADEAGAGNGYRSLSASLRTALSPEAVVAHYAAQMAREGWTLGKPMSASDAASQLVRKTLSVGDVTGVLDDFRTADGLHHVALRLRVATPERRP